LTHAKNASHGRVKGINGVTLDGKCIQCGVESLKKHSNSAPTSTPRCELAYRPRNTRISRHKPQPGDRKLRFFHFLSLNPQ